MLSQCKIEVVCENCDSEGHLCLDYCPFQQMHIPVSQLLFTPLITLDRCCFCRAFQKQKVSASVSTPTTSSLLSSHFARLLTDQQSATVAFQTKGQWRNTEKVVFFCPTLPWVPLYRNPAVIVISRCSDHKIASFMAVK